jgi:hypothetical protein
MIVRERSGVSVGDHLTGAEGFRVTTAVIEDFARIGLTAVGSAHSARPGGGLYDSHAVK